MLSRIPVSLDKLDKKELRKQILRVAIIAELDAISLYEQLASMTDDENLKKVLLDVAKEEKTHVGEFLEMLLSIDKEQVEEIEKGREEIREILEK